MHTSSVVGKNYFRSNQEEFMMLVRLSEKERECNKDAHIWVPFNSEIGLATTIGVRSPRVVIYGLTDPG